MRIIIVGGGKVGATLAEMLDKENHDVILVDENQEVVDEVTSKFDIMGVCGNGVVAGVLTEAGVQKSDLLIAVTEQDEVNLLCCLVAKKLGVKSTIARVRNPEYSEEINIIQEDLGLSMVINPEQAAAREMGKLVRFPSAIEISTFAKGRVEIFKIVIKENSPLDGMKIKNLFHKTNLKVLVCAIQRGDDVFIPGGESEITAGDKISVVAPENEIVKFFKFADCLQGRINSAILVGGGKIAYYLAQILTRDGITVKIVEKNEARAEELSESLNKVTIINGSREEHKTLIDEGIETVGAFASLTDLDEENMLLSIFASSKSKAKIMTKINRPAMCEIAGDMDLGSIITPRTITAAHILRYVRAMQNSFGSSIQTLYRLVNDKVEAMEFRIREQSKLLGVPLMELKLKKGLLVACISRKGKVIIPGGRDTIEFGDTVIVVTTLSGFDDITDILDD